MMTRNQGTPTRRAGYRGWASGLRRAGLMLLAASVAGAALDAQANPQGGQVVAGRGSISAPNNNLTVINQNSNKLVINWSSFNIGAGQTVQFIQPSKNSAALNRILSESPSQIFGNLLANGQIYLLNGNGIFFSKDAYVNTGALFASSLNISNGDFLAGRMDFSAPFGQDGGPIVNHGTLIAANGGSVNLIGGSVYNDGVIEATLGQVDMIAGHAVTVDFDGDGLMSFVVTAPVMHKMLDAQSGNAVDNEGTVEANGGAVLMTANVARDVFAAAVNNGGVVEATGVREKQGSVFLTGPDFGSNGIVGRTQADHSDQNADVVKSGSITLSGKNGNVVNTGTLDADNAYGNGGQVVLQSNITTITRGDSLITAQSSTGIGGEIDLLGANVGVFDSAILNASGAFGGGTVLVGGDYHGENPDVQNAFQTVVGTGTTIDANALYSGNGGKVILWSNNSTGFFGSISAQGGANGGNGGFVETSTHSNSLNIGGVVNTLAPAGTAGNWLLDPIDVTVATGGTATLANVATFAAATCTNCTIDPSTINGAAANVVIQAQQDITVTNAIAMTGAGITLTMQAGRSIIDNASISTNNGNISLIANNTTNNDTNAAGGALTGSGGTNRGGSGNSGVAAGGTATLTVGSGVTINAGTQRIKLLVSNAAGVGASTSGDIVINSSASLTTTGGNVIISTGSNVSGAAGGVATQGGSISTAGNSAALGTAGGSVTIDAGANSGSGGVNLGSITTTGGTSSGNNGGAVGGAISIGTTANDATTSISLGAVNSAAGNSGTGTHTGAAGGAVALTSTGAVTLTSTVTTTGGSSVGARAGGTAGALTITANGEVDLDGSVSMIGGAAGGTGTDGAGGALTIKNTGNLVKLNDNINLSAGSGGGTGSTSGTLALGSTGVAANQVGSVTQTGIITAGGLTADSTGSITLGSASNAISTITAANVITNGAFVLNNGTTPITLTGSVTTNGGAFTLTDDQMTLTGGINAGAGLVTLEASSASTTITIGGNTADSAGSLEINSTDLSAITTSGGLTIGSSSNTGGISTGANITGSGGMLNGVTGGTITLITGNTSSTSAINIGNTIDTNSRPLTLIADTINITKALTAGTGHVTITANDAADQILLGGADVAGSKLGLTSAELNFITTTGGLTIGSTSNTGGIDLNTAGALSFTGVTTATSTITLLTDGGITDSAGGSLTPASNVNLAFSAGTSVVLPALTTLGTGTLAATASTVSAGSITQAGILTVAGAATFTTGGALINLNNTGNDFSSVSLTNTGANAITLDDKNSLTLTSVTSAGVVNINFGQSGGSTLTLGTTGSISGSSVTFTGGAGSDTIIGQTGNHTWTVTGSNSGTYTDGASTFNFSSVENLTGNSGNDAFVIAGGTLSGSINGGTGTNTLQGDNLTNSWTITGANTGTVTGVGGTFSNIGSLTGGSGSDTFTFSSGAQLTGNVDGGSGTDTLDFHLKINSVVVTLTGSTATGYGGNTTGSTTNPILGTFSGINSITGGSASNTLNGENVASAWNITGSNSGTYNDNAGNGTLAFSAFATLNGGTNNDTFTVSGGGTVSTIAGGGGTDTLAGDNLTNAWSITGANAGSLVSASGTVNFTGISSLTGGTGSDTFTFSSGASLSGNVSGGTGSDTLDFHLKTNAVVVTLTGSTAAGYSGNTTGSTTNPILGTFSGIESITGGSASNTLNGENATNAWGITGNNSGTYNDGAGNGSLTWSAFGTLVGGTGNDTFTFTDAKTLTGTINGTSGTDKIDYTAYTTATNVVLTGNTANGLSGTDGGITGGFSNIDNIAGSGTASNTLTGENVGNTWIISGANSGTVNDGTVTLTWSNFGSLTGGSNTDSFTLASGTLTGSINGAGGSNTLTGDNVSNTWTVTGANTGTLTGIGGSFSNIGTLVGGTNNDNFVFSNAATLSGTLDGGAGGANTLDLSAYNTEVDVALSGSGAHGYTGATSGATNPIQGGNFSEITSLKDGSAATNVLTGENTASTWNVTGANSGNYNDGAGNGTFAFSGISDLIGGSNTDSFTLASGTLTGSIDGGGGNNTLQGDNVVNSWTVTGSNAGTVTGVGGTFTNIGSLVGGSNNDTFTFSNGATVTGTVDGGAGGVNVLDLGAYTTVVDVALSGSTANGYSGTTSKVGATPNPTGGFADITSIADGSGANTLTGENAASTWNITGGNSGTLNDGTATLTWSGFGSLTGGSNSDAFTLASGTLTGSINGGGGSNTLQGDNVVNSWTVTGSNAGTVTGVGGSFTNIGSLVGGSNNDTFTFNNGATVTGTVDGGAGGVNVLDL
ncbi:MAG: filamentous hemagglutinin N-terminal domain-containing protein, partial [Bacillota bacterium]